MMNNDKVELFRKQIEKTYRNSPTGCGGSFGEIICYEIHSQPVNPRMRSKTLNNGFDTGLTFRELAHKWGISCTFLGELILDHCRRLDK